MGSNTSPDEILSVFDQQRNIINELPRSVVRAEPKMHWHGVADIFVVDDQGRILCSKRSERMQNNPNKWQVRFGGHVKAGQSFLQTTINELAEEAGLHATQETLIPLESGSKAKYLVHYSYFVYHILPTDQIQLNDGEVAETRWMTVPEYLKSHAQEPDIWCKNLHSQTLQALMAHIAQRG